MQVSWRAARQTFDQLEVAFASYWPPVPPDKTSARAEMERYCEPHFDLGRCSGFLCLSLYLLFSNSSDFLLPLLSLLLKSRTMLPFLLQLCSSDPFLLFNFLSIFLCLLLRSLGFALLCFGSELCFAVYRSLLLLGCQLCSRQSTMEADLLRCCSGEGNRLDGPSCRLET